MKSSKAQTHAKCHVIPALRFDDQQLTSFSGLVLFQVLFTRLKLKARLKSCFCHLRTSAIFSSHVVVFLLIIHMILGFRRLRDMDYYRDDPLVGRVLGLRELPNVSTVSRALAKMDATAVEQFRELSCDLVVERLVKEAFACITLDFDGTVQSTKGHAEGTAVGFNKQKKGARSYYPLMCTVAQTGQFFDLHHRPGNVHDSNGASEFMHTCFDRVREELNPNVLECRMDSAFFEKALIEGVDAAGVRFTASVPFERFAELKLLIVEQRHWGGIDDEWSFFETPWKPKSWDKQFRFIFIRHKVKRQQKGPLQLDLFEPLEFGYEYTVIVTNKKEQAKNVVLFHHGRGSQEAVFGEAKEHAALDVVPTRRCAGNQIVTLCAMMAHNLGRELQMATTERERRTHPKRRAAWCFETLNTLRRRLIQRAGRLIRPQGKLTLSMSANERVQHDLLHALDTLQATG